MQEVAAAGGFPSSSSSSSSSLLLLLFPRAFPLRRGHRGSPPSPAAGMMSKVRVSSSSSSSGSPRMEARQQQQPPLESPPTKPSACRSLFGPVDHQELARELRRHRREQEEASRARWNFDFQRHRPLRGRYQWEALRSQALPDFYTRTRPLQADGGDSPEGQQRKRPAVQDSFPPNKRANTTEEEEEEEEEEGEEAISEGSPGGASSEEQTPKKSRQRPT